MTKRQIIGWLLVAPFLIVLAGSIIFTSYTAITEAPGLALVAAGFISAIAGFFMLMND